jgi:Cu(I)/Ag(I) efflux system protein CusF
MIIVLAGASLAAMTAMAAQGQSGTNMSGMQMAGTASARNEKMGHTSGKVVEIDAAHSKITIAHRPVAALGWPAMTMTFLASSHQLEGIKTGDHVDFEFYMRGKAPVIERIHKIG